MALFRVQQFKRLDSSDREWSNTYLIEATDLAAAVTAANPLLGREQNIHADNVTILRQRISDLDPETDNFVIVTSGLVGQAYTAEDFEQLPLYNTVRVDIDVFGGGRPSRKFYRAPVGEQWNINGNLDSTVLTLFNDEVAGMIADVVAQGGELVDPQGQAWTTPTTIAAIQMRQRHRRRRSAAPTP